jgi:predicted MPP superfamily phosphohydrolase
VILSFFLSNSFAGYWAVFLAIVFCSWGFYSAHKIHTVTIGITNPKIRNKVRLVQISDVHIGSRKPAYLQKVIDRVHMHSPDLLVITGDLVDENVSREDMTPLASLSCPVLYCSGNHERYIDHEKVLKIFASHGVQVLNDQSVELLGLRVIGVGDRQQQHEAVAMLGKISSSNSDAGSISGIDGHAVSPFTVLLYHQPDIWDAAKLHGIELMLSGHTHKGQIWPFGLLVRTRYRHVAGHFQASLSHLFVSQGTGTWGPLMRFGTRCEMTVIDLQST